MDPTASVKRGVFAPADTWVSTEYLFRRDEDGDYWLVDNRGAVIRTERGPVYASPSTTRSAGSEAVDLAVTYGVDAGGQRVAVTALALRPGGSVASADLSEALAICRSERRPTSCTWCRRWRSARRTAPRQPAACRGNPEASRNAWYLDPDTNRYKRLTAAVRTEIVGAEH